MSNPDETKHFSLLKKVVGYKTYESWVSVPHVTFIYEGDATDVLTQFFELKERDPAEGITINTLLLKILVEGIKAAPQVNAHIKYSSRYVTGSIEPMREINISTPWLLENGEMVTINLRNFESKSLTQMQEYIDKAALRIKNCDIYIPMYKVSVGNMLGELKEGRLLKTASALLGSVFGKSPTTKSRGEEIKAYNKIADEDKITAEDLVPGSITISNIGSLYKEQKGFMGILEIIPPQIVAIGLGSIQEKAGVVENTDGEKSIGIRKVIPMCIAFDHRALNFNEIVPLLKKLDYIFEHPELLEGWY